MFGTLAGAMGVSGVMGSMLGSTINSMRIQKTKEYEAFLDQLGGPTPIGCMPPIPSIMPKPSIELVRCSYCGGRVPVNKEWKCRNCGASLP